MSIWPWAKHFSETPEEFQLTLGEGETPLVASRRIGPSLGLENLYFKVETGNPTGSYKDRFAAAAISDMLAQGKRHCVSTSSGNTGAALAAYCAAAKLDLDIATVEPAPADKLAQMMAYGANIFRVRGFGIDPDLTRETFARLETLASGDQAALQISAFKFSPVGMNGVKTISYELTEQLPAGIDHVFSPAGGGGLTLAVVRGFADLSESGELSRVPAVECVQPEGNDTIASPLRDDLDEARSVDCTTTVSGLQVPDDLDGSQVIHACRSSGGSGHLVTDEDVWSTQARLAKEEGIFCEPAGAVALAGAMAALGKKQIDPAATIVCLVTGSGFKDRPSVDRMTSGVNCPLVTVDQMATALSRP